MSSTLELILPRVRANFDEFANLQPAAMLHSSLNGYLYPNGGWYLFRFPINFDNFEWNLRIIRQIKDIEIRSDVSEKYVDLLQLITRIKALEQRFKTGVQNLIDAVRNSNTVEAERMQKLFQHLFDNTEDAIDEKISPEKAQTEGDDKIITHPKKERDLDEELNASIQMMPDSLRDGIEDLILKLRQTDPNASEKLECIFREYFERKESQPEDGEVDLVRSLQVEAQAVSPFSSSPPPPAPPLPAFLFKNTGSNPVVAKGNKKVSNQEPKMNLIDELKSKGFKKKFDLSAYEVSLKKLKEDRKEAEKNKDTLWGAINIRREVLEEEKLESSSSSEWE